MKETFLKTLLLMSIFLLSTCSALSADKSSSMASCESLDIQLGGIISWKKRDRKTKKIKTFTNYSQIGTKWNSNDDFYEKLIIKSSKKIESVSISIKRKSGEEKVGTYKVLKKKDYEISGFSFKDEVTKKTKPFDLKFNIILTNKKTCQQTVQVKRAE